jgi:hypothetical protein
MTSSSWYQQELKNKNYLSPIGFKLAIQKSPKISFLCQEVEIPQLSLGRVDVPYRGFVALPIEGNMRYGDFSLEFLIDEDLQNYLELHDWMRGLGSPANSNDREKYLTSKQQIVGSGIRGVDTGKLEEVSEATLIVQNNNLNMNFEIVFHDMFPTSLAALPFSVMGNDNDYLTARATFAYTYFDVVKSYDSNGAPKRSG